MFDYFSFREDEDFLASRCVWVNGAVIVGASPSGLAVGAGLKEQGVPSVILERADCIASLWQKRTYDRLKLHLPKQFCELPKFPFPDHFPTYPTKKHYVGYLESYAKHLDLNPQFNERVQSAMFDEDSRLWRVKTASPAGAEVEYICQWLVVAAGEVIHACDFKSTQKVVMVGSGNSDMEVCLDLCNRDGKPSIICPSSNTQRNTHVLDIGALQKFRSGKARVVPGNKKFSARTVELATGYRSNVPYWLQDSEKSIQIPTKSRCNSSEIGNSIGEEAVICDVCQEQIIKSESDGTPIWGQTVCEKHKYDRTPICSSCSRFKIKNMQFFRLNDGRPLCLDCSSTVILDLESCRSLISQVYEFYANLKMHIEKDIPVYLVDQIEMNRLNKNPDEIILGLTIFMEEEIEGVKPVENLPNKYTVIAILLLHGYPKLAMGATLAHEMMHTWLQCNIHRELELKVEEGMCEFMAYIWLEWYGLFGDENSVFMRTFKENLKNKMETSKCKIYGDGFREAKEAVEKYGFKDTIDNIASTGKFLK